VPSATALRSLLTKTATKLEKYQTKGEAAAFTAHVENTLLKEELKESKASNAKTRENAAALVNRLQVEQEESVPVIVAVGLGMSGLGTLAGIWAHNYVKKNHPGNDLAKYATPIVGAGLMLGAVMLTDVSPEEKARGIRRDFTVMSGGLGLGGGMLGGSGYQLFEDYKVANP